MLTPSLARTVALLGAFLIVATSTLAQPTIIRGVVVDTWGNPIEDAKVSLAGGPFNRSANANTDSRGHFELIVIRGGQWVFSASRRGYQPFQIVSNVRSTKVNHVELRMTPDPLNPPAPASGQLAGLRADDIQAAIDAAHELFDRGDYDAAIAAYRALLERIPVLTALNLQIGHVYSEKQEYRNARAAFEAVRPESRAAAEATAALKHLGGGASSR